MEEINIPATEATGGDDMSHYEFAFHILPTVTEEEVPAVFGDLKTLIDHAGGHIIQEEAPQHFDLAYTVVTHSEGKNFKYNHSFFGWVRFMSLPEHIEKLQAEIKHDGRVMRHIIIALTKAEMEHPFKVFEVKRKHKPEVEKDEEAPKVAEVVKEVSEEEIEKSLEGITA